MDDKALFVRFTADAGYEADVADFLRDARGPVEEEPDTRAWYAIRFTPPNCQTSMCLPRRRRAPPEFQAAILNSVLPSSSSLSARLAVVRLRDDLSREAAPKSR